MANGKGIQELLPVHNSDVDAGNGFVASLAFLGFSVQHPALIELFKEYDSVAKRYKALFHRTGSASIVVAWMSLVLAAVDLALRGAGLEVPHWFSAVGAVMALVALSLAAASSVLRFRNKWLAALFFRERLRQWHFQCFLDGAFIERSITDPKHFENERQARFEGLKQTFLFPGYLSAYREEPPNSPFSHGVTPYTRVDVRDEVNRVLDELRFRYQLGYGNSKTEETSATPSMTVSEVADRSETLARVLMASAVVLVLLQLVSPLMPNEASMALVLGALVLATASSSAAIRAYRAGNTLPDEAEHYNQYSAEVRAVYSDFSNAPPDEKQQYHLQLEKVAVDELKKFLRIKSRATFLF